MNSRNCLYSAILALALFLLVHSGAASEPRPATKPVTGSITSPEDSSGNPPDEACRSPFQQLPDWVELRPFHIRCQSRAQIKKAIADSLSHLHSLVKKADFGAITLSTYSFRVTDQTVVAEYSPEDYHECRSKGEVQVHLIAKVRYPVWENVDSCEDGDLVEDWRRYVAGMYRHELGHANIAQAGLSRLREELNQVEVRRRGMTRTQACDLAAEAYHNLLEQVFKDITSQISQAHSNYDSRTEYGRTQGADF